MRPAVRPFAFAFHAAATPTRMTDAGQPVRGSSGPGFRIVLGLAALALCLRVAALSAGPGQGMHYHPDVAKQVRAVQQFLQGDYLVIRHGRNYDGYPLFNSHLVEYLYRIASPPVEQVLRLVGAGSPETARALPDPENIAWVMLLWNAGLSAAAVGLAVVIARRFGAAAGILAGVLAVVSPLDVVSAHYATGDTAAAVFALATVYAAVRILESGDLRFYVLGALSTAAAFSAKYNAGVAGTALVAAHLLRYPGRQALSSGAAWRRTGAATAALAAGLVLTSPALLVNPTWTARSIRDFLAFVADYGLTDAQLRLPYRERILLSLQGNGEHVVRAAGLFALAGVAAALKTARPRQVVWVVAALPLTLLSVALALKPVSPAVHLLPATLPLLVLAAAGTAALLAKGRPRRMRVAGAALAAGAVIGLASATRDELFFFARSDTRRIAETWVKDSVPANVAIDAGRAFRQPPLAAGQTAGAVHFLTPEHSRPPMSGEVELARFVLEERSLPVFRNKPIVARIQAPALIAPAFDLPLWAPLPSLRDDELAFVDAPAFYRSPLVRDLAVNASIDVTAVSARPLERAWLVVRAGSAPARVNAGFGGRNAERLLGAGEVAVIPVEHPRPLRSAYDGNHFYRWVAKTRIGAVRVALVTDEATLGRYCFNERLFGESWRALDAAGGLNAPPGRRIEHAIAGLASGSLTIAAAATIAGDLLDVATWDEAEVRKRFGIHPGWLDGLPYVTLTAGETTATPVAVEREGTGSPPPRPWLATPQFEVPPGRYLLEVSAESWTGPLQLEVRDACGRTLQRLDVTSPGSAAPADRRLLLQLPPAAAYALALTPLTGEMVPAGVLLKLHPDVVGTVQSRLDLLRRLLGQPVPGAPDPSAYDALVAAGDRAGDRGEEKLAAALYREAALADPGRRAARERLGESRSAPERRQAAARFRSGIELVSFQTDASELHAGGSIGLQLQWVLPEDLAKPDGVFSWVHAVDGNGAIAFQGDHPLLADARAPADDDREEGCWYRFPIPVAVPPGDYELRFGLWRPGQGTRIRVVDAAVAHTRDSLSLARVTVAPSAATRPRGANEP